MKPGISIKVIREPDEDQLFRYRIILSNGLASASLDFWGYSNSFKDFAKELIDFPKTNQDTVTYQLGNDRSDEQPNSAYYLLLKAFCTDAAGHTAIKVVVDNHQEGSDYQRSQFYIKSEPNSLNQLGKKLEAWDPTNVKELNWLAKY
jgi:hypothetical protein